jgi:hypothetical protein
MLGAFCDRIAPSHDPNASVVETEKQPVRRDVVGWSLRRPASSNSVKVVVQLAAFGATLSFAERFAKVRSPRAP